MNSNSVNDAINILKAKKRDLEIQLKGIEMSIELLRNEIPYTKLDSNDGIDNNLVYESKINDDKYRTTMTNKQKFVYFLDKLGRFVHFREVAEMINEYEGGKYNVSDLASSLSASTASLKKKGLLVKYQEGNENRNTFWGKKNWLNEDGKIKKEFMYNETFLSDKIDSDLSLFS